MSEVRYPYGYGKATATMAQLEARYGTGAPIPAHPEYWKRIKSYLISKKGKIGIGGAYRFVQPDANGFAPPGMSFHEKQAFASGLQVYSAIDLVVLNGSKVHRAPTWSEVPRQGSGHPDIKTFGLHCNVPGEPWHIQCFEIDGYSTWKNNGRKDPRANYPVPGGSGGSGGSTGGNEVYKLAPTPTLRQGSTGDEVRDLQNQCKFWGWGDVGNPDGKYGPRTVDAVEVMQAQLKVGVDGTYGPRSAQALESFLQYMKDVSENPPPSKPTYKPGERVLRVTTPKMQGPDVKWVQQTLKDQGMTITVDGWYGGESKARVATMQGWNNLPKTGIVDKSTWDVLKLY